MTSIRFPYDPPKRVSILFTLPTMAKESFKEETDINTIMQRYERTGLLEHTRDVSPQYGDFSNVMDYQSALNQIMDAQAAFDTLSARVRRRFNNDPAEFLAFFQDPDNADEARELGFMNPEPPAPAPSPPESGGEADASGGSAQGGADKKTTQAKPAGE